MDTQVVYETDTAYDMQCGPHGYDRVGIRIEERVIWRACDHSSASRGEYERWERISQRIVDALKNGEFGEGTK